MPSAQMCERPVVHEGPQAASLQIRTLAEMMTSLVLDRQQTLGADSECRGRQVASNVSKRH